jgi:hypothetical protein
MKVAEAMTPLLLIIALTSLPSQVLPRTGLLPNPHPPLGRWVRRDPEDEL